MSTRQAPSPRKRHLAFGLAAAFCLAALASPVWGQTYGQRSKRDPFINLGAARSKEKAPTLVQPPPFSQRPPGLSGLLISEVGVVGTAASSKQRIVILKGTDNFTYVAREASKLFDGYVESINSTEVVFVREVFDTTGKKTTTKVVKQYSIETR